MSKEYDSWPDVCASALEVEVEEWKSRALAAEARVAFLEEHGRELFKAYDAEEGIATALVKLEMALKGGPVT